VQCLQKGAAEFGWSKRPRTPGTLKEGQWLVGLGMAAAIRPNFRRKAEARVRMDENRNVTVEMDMTDIGTGSYTIFAQVAADTLDLPIDKVTVKLGHSSYPDTPGSGGSFGAASCCAALREACLSLKKKLEAGQGPGNLQAEAKSEPGDEFKKFSQQSYGAHFAEVAVDATTGEVRLRRMLGVFDGGRILNPKTARSQLIGGMIWGVGSRCTRTRLSIRVLACSSTTTSRAITCRCTPTSRRSKRSCWRASTTSRTHWVRRASASSASAARARRSPTPSTTPAACACATIRSRRTRS
jgi:xanthine dehydrogenase YagR molybdenum-binding subunit